jgi:hypothetical protein
VVTDVVLDEGKHQLAWIELWQVGGEKEIGDAVEGKEMVEVVPCCLTKVDGCVVYNEEITMTQAASINGSTHKCEEVKLSV